MNRVVDIFKVIGNSLFKKLNIESDRTRNISMHVLFSFLYKGGSIVIGFLVIPLTIKYLDNEHYGVWLTLNAFVAWFTFFDIGLGNGLRNKFSESVAQSNFVSARYYVSTTYFTVLAISLLLFTVFVIANGFIDWSRVFNVSDEIGMELSSLMPVVFGLFCLQLVLKLVTTIYTADQHHSMQGKVNFIIQLTGLIAICILNVFSKSSLFLYGFIVSVVPVVVLMILNFWAFKGRYHYYLPNIKFWKNSCLKDVFGLGMGFFVIQIAGVILFTTDNFIITQLFGAAAVVPYNIAYKYFSIVNMILSIMLTPFWSSITNAYTKGDFDWIKKTMRNLTIISLSGIIVVAAMVLLSPWFYSIWVGDSIDVPFQLTISMAVFFVIYNAYAPFTYFINGTGKIRLQMYTIVVMSAINIPLAVFFGKYMEMGLSGVILATVICLLPHAVLLPIQYHKIVNHKANGIWNK